MIDENSKAFQWWKRWNSSYYFRDDHGTQRLYRSDLDTHPRIIDDITIKDFGNVHYVSWTEGYGDPLTLIINEVEPRSQTRLRWELTPSDGLCSIFLKKWTEDALYIIYRDEKSFYAMQVVISKEPQGISVRTIELDDMICVKRNWIVGYKSFPGRTIPKGVSLFDLKNFRHLDTIPEEEAIQQDIIPGYHEEKMEELD